MGLLSGIAKAIGGVLKGANSHKLLLQICHTSESTQTILQTASTYKTTADIRRAIAGLADKYLGKRGKNSLHPVAESLVAQALVAQAPEPVRSFPAFKQLIREQKAIDDALKDFFSKLPKGK